MPRIPNELRTAYDAALSNDNRVDAAEANALIEASASVDSGCFGALRRRGRTGLRRLLADNRDRFDDDAAAEVGRFVGVETPPRSPKLWDLAADRRVWTTTYWPYADFSDTGRGNPRHNLWADGGPLDKLDQLLKARGETQGAKDHEKKPALSWLAGRSSESGYFIPSATIKESDAERTTGVDFSGTGRLDPDAKRDFLDAYGNFGRNGATDGTMEVGWWGSCDKVAIAGQLFDKPKRSVTVDGVTFTPQDIKGLLTVIADSQAKGSEFTGHRFNGNPDVVTLKDGSRVQGTITNLKLEDFRSGSFRRVDGDVVVRSDIGKDVTVKKADGEAETIEASRIASVARESDRDLSPVQFHTTTKKWLREKRPFAMDHDPGPHVWNDCYDHAKIKKTRGVPRDVDLTTLNGHEGPYSGGRLCFYETSLLKGSNPDKKYAYWIEKKDGKDVNGGWLHRPGFDRNPDFMWRPRAADPSFSGRNQRNPHVRPEMVEEIYRKSI